MSDSAGGNTSSSDSSSFSPEDLDDEVAAFDGVLDNAESLLRMVLFILMLVKID